MTTAPPICLEKDRWTVQVRPFHRSGRDCAPAAVNAQTSVDEVAPAATTTSLGWPGNATCVQVDPLRRQAVGTEPWLKAQPPFLPTATTAVKPPNGPLCTCLTMRQAGGGGCAVPPDPRTWAASAGAARAGKDAAVVTASTVAVTAAARRTTRRVLPELLLSM